MRNTITVLLTLLFFLQPFVAFGQTVIASNRGSAAIVVDSSDALVVGKAAQMLASDIETVTGSRPQLLGNLPRRASTIIIAGTVEGNALISRLQASGKIDLSPIQGEWERYMLTTVRNPFPGIGRAVVIAGSDRRGAAYGLLSISESMGVSPWVWWADVPYPHKDRVTVPAGTIVSKGPSVKYRGIFINDEDWGLLPWASKTFDPEYGNIGPKTYSKVCELLLRLKGNYLCPAMHRRSVAFNEDPRNKMVADSFAIVMGSVHCEPLLFNNAREWDKKVQGEWNYQSNGQTIQRVLRERVRSNGSYENVYTLALRGLHDKSMEGDASLEVRRQTLCSALADQRRILEEELGVPVESVPQAFTPYKEVLEIYNKGVELPEGITIIWPDDNYGYLKQLSNSREQKRDGRAGVYYHVSYHGKPHDYLWFSTTPPALMYEELNKAYRTGADRIWLLNAGDIKMCEYHTDLFLRMAWDMDAFDFASVANDNARWLAGIFGTEHEDAFIRLTGEYYRLAFSSKPEYMAWGQEWNSRFAKQARIEDTGYSFTSYWEAQKRMEDYSALCSLADSVLSLLPENSRAAYHELVSYSVKGSHFMNRMHLKSQQSRLYRRQGRSSAVSAAQDAIACHDSLQTLVRQYDSLLEGKWKNLSTLEHGVTANYFRRPQLSLESVLSASGYGLAVQGEDISLSGSRHIVPAITSLRNCSRRFEVFNRGLSPGKWFLEASADWVRLSCSEGSADAAIDFSVDWSKFLHPGTYEAEIRLRGEDGTLYSTAFVSAVVCEEVPKKLDKLFVEDAGCVSIPASAYVKKTIRRGIDFRSIPGLGFEGESVQLGDPLAVRAELADTVSSISYRFWSFGAGQVDVYTYALPTFPLHERESANEDYAGASTLAADLVFGLRIDDSHIAAPSIPAAEYSQSWTEGVLHNCSVRRTQMHVSRPGLHTLEVLVSDPGVVLQKIVIDFGGMRRSLLGAPATPSSVISADECPAVVQAGEFHLLPASASAVGGILGTQLDRTRSGRVAKFITGASSPAVQLFSEAQLTEKQKSWRGEHVGKWLCAASDLYAHTGSEQMLKRICEVADYLLERQQKDGWLGCYTPEHRFYNPGIGPGWDVWINTYNIKGLVAASKVSGNASYADAAQRIADLLYETFIVRRVDFGSTGFHGGLVATGSIEPLTDLYELRPTERNRSLVAFCMEQMDSIEGLGLVKKFASGQDAQTIGNGKIYELLRNLTGLAKYSRLTADADLADVCAKAWQNISSLHISPSGCPWGGVDVHNEVFNPEGFFSAHQVCETCSAMEWLHFTSEMLKLKGGACYAEELEKTLYNAIPGAMGGEKSEWVYYTRLNGAVHRGNEWSCCWSSGMMASENIPDLLYSTADGVARVNVYCPSVLEGILEQSGDYAHLGEVRLKILSDGLQSLQLRRPAWAGEFAVELNGQACAWSMDSGFICINRSWKVGDSVSLSFKIEDRKVSLVDSKTGYFASAHLRGPLLLGASSSDLHILYPMCELPWLCPSEEYNYWFYEK